MTYRDSRVRIGDISHTRVIGGTVANKVPYHKIRP